MSVCLSVPLPCPVHPFANHSMACIPKRTVKGSGRLAVWCLYLAKATDHRHCSLWLSWRRYRSKKPLCWVQALLSKPSSWHAGLDDIDTESHLWQPHSPTTACGSIALIHLLPTRCIFNYLLFCTISKINITRKRQALAELHAGDSDGQIDWDLPITVSNKKLSYSRQTKQCALLAQILSTAEQKNEVKASHTRYRALGLELIPVYNVQAASPQVTIKSSIWW